MTGRESLCRWVSIHRSQAAAARALGLTPQHLHLLLHDQTRGGMRRPTARRISIVTGIPLIALLMLDEHLPAVPAPTCAPPLDGAAARDLAGTSEEAA